MQQRLTQHRSLLFLVHAHNIILVDSLAGNDDAHGIALLQGASQLLLLALHLHLPLLKLALQALLVALHHHSCTPIVVIVIPRE